jgi:hypothetical protein
MRRWFRVGFALSAEQRGGSIVHHGDTRLNT